MLAMATSIAGKFLTTRSIAAFRELVDTYGPWSELSEYCLHAMSGALMLGLRGDHGEAWQWVEKAVARVRRSQHVAAALPTACLIHRARALLAGL